LNLFRQINTVHVANFGVFEFVFFTERNVLIKKQIAEG